MNSYKLIFLAFLTFLFTACERAFMEPNPKTDPLSIFNEYATLVKEKYAMLDFKGVDIDKLSDSLRSTISPTITDRELFEKLAVITRRLRDGHSPLAMNRSDSLAPVIDFDLLAGYPAGLDIEILAKNYINTDLNPSMKTIKGGPVGIKAIWGTLLQDKDIAYLWIPSWDIELTDKQIDSIFIDIKPSKGLIFDMRLNGGGDPSLATKFASYFTDKNVDTGFERFKTGPGPKDFSDSRVILKPTSSPNKYLKQVRVLTDRHVYSASTTFLYSVDPIATIKTMGQRSGGGSGSVADGYLANGWYWGLSTSEFIDAKGRHLDDGVDPDIPVFLNVNDKTKDEVMEAALADLK